MEVLLGDSIVISLELLELSVGDKMFISFELLELALFDTESFSIVTSPWCILPTSLVTFSPSSLT